MFPSPSNCRTPPFVSSYSTPSVPRTTQQIRNTRSNVAGGDSTSSEQEITDEMWQRELAELFSLSNLAEEGATNSARVISSQHYTLYAILTALVSLLVVKHGWYVCMCVCVCVCVCVCNDVISTCVWLCSCTVHLSSYRYKKIVLLLLLLLLLFNTDDHHSWIVKINTAIKLSSLSQFSYYYYVTLTDLLFTVNINLHLIVCLENNFVLVCVHVLM